MAINKKLIHFKNFSDFNSKKLSANENNTQYTLGINGAVTNGSPDILYQSICYIKDTKQQWTHGQLYDGSKSDTPLNETDPVFSASPAAGITEGQIRTWDNTHEFVEELNGDVSELYNALDGKQDAISDLTNIRNGAAKGATAVQPSSLATVATSGSYNDLLNKPTIPSAVTESTVSGWGFTKNAGTYSKPSTGIPVSDLAGDIQTSLGKANTALQSYTEQYKGTITGVSANGTSVATSGVANIPAATTSKYGVTKLSSATNSTSTTLAATASAVKAAYDLANSYKGTVTGVKINGTTKNPSNGVVDLGTVITEYQPLKTINGESIIGSGDITISGGGDYLPLTGGTITGDLTLTSGTGGPGNFSAYSVGASEFFGQRFYFSGSNYSLEGDDSNLYYCNQFTDTVVALTWKGDGTKFLSDDGTYKTISSGSSDANIQAVDTGDVIDDVNVDYATKTYVDGLVEDINSVLESINGGASGGSSSGGSGAYSEVNHGTSDTTFTLTPNVFHIWDEVASLTLDLGSETSGVANEYLFQFNSGATATSLTLPDDLKWAGGEAPTIEANKIYQISILKGLGSVLEWDNAPTLIENKVTMSISGTKYLVSLQYAAASDIVVKVRTPDGPISVNILSGETSKMANPMGPMVDSSAYIESITPADDNIYNYVW